jgi:hypothetical protein
MDLAGSGYGSYLDIFVGRRKKKVVNIGILEIDPYFRITITDLDPGKLLTDPRIRIHYTVPHQSNLFFPC